MKNYDGRNQIVTTFVILLLNVWMLSIQWSLRAFKPQVMDLFTLSSFWG